MTSFPSSLNSFPSAVMCACVDMEYWARHGDVWIQVQPTDIVTYERGNLLVNGIPGDIYAIQDLAARWVAWAAYKATCENLG